MKNLWLSVVLILGSFFTVVFFGVRAVQMFFEGTPVTVMIDKKMVYQGPAYGIEVDSAGANTGVGIYGAGFFDLKLKAYYCSRDIVIK